MRLADCGCPVTPVHSVVAPLAPVFVLDSFWIRGSENGSVGPLKFQPSRSGDFLSFLPDELVAHILSFCNVKSHCRLAQVSRALRHASADSPLWRRFAEQLQQGDTVSNLETRVLHPSAVHYRACVRHFYEAAFTALTRDARRESLWGDVRKYGGDFASQLCLLVAMLLLLVGCVLTSLQLSGLLPAANLLQVVAPAVVGFFLIIAVLAFIYRSDEPLMRRGFIIHSALSIAYICVYLLLAGLRDLFPATSMAAVLTPLYVLLVHNLIYVAVNAHFYRRQGHVAIMLMVLGWLISLAMLTPILTSVSETSVTVQQAFIPALVGYLMPIATFILVRLCRACWAKFPIEVFATYLVMVYVACIPFLITHAMLSFGVRVVFAFIPVEAVWLVMTLFMMFKRAIPEGRAFALYWRTYRQHVLASPVLGTGKQWTMLDVEVNRASVQQRLAFARELVVLE